MRDDQIREQFKGGTSVVRAPSLWFAVPALYLFMFFGLCLVCRIFTPIPITLGQAVYYIAWLFWTSYTNALVPAIHGYVPLPSTIVLLCALALGLLVSAVFLRGWFRLSAVFVVIIVWTMHAIGIVAASL